MEREEAPNRRDDAFEDLIRALGIGSDEDLYALTVQFPSIAHDPRLDLPQISVAAAANLSMAVMTNIRQAATKQVAFQLGALPPINSPIGAGYQQPPIGGLASTAPAAAPASHMPLGAEISHPLGTPVRDQGARGTCVAFAVAACEEARLPHNDLSEQFLYWAAKMQGGDPIPNTPGTWLYCADAARSFAGICSEAHWPYVPTPIVGNESQYVAGVSPSASALADAATRAYVSAAYANNSHQTSGKAPSLYSELAVGPVAVSLPVFLDPMSGDSNWGWLGAIQHGQIIDPTPFSSVIGGHAVCICGYMPSASAPGGGWFVFKNSWGTTAWGTGGGTVPPGHPTCGPGFGYISQRFVDLYLWEYLRL